MQLTTLCGTACLSLVAFIGSIGSLDPLFHLELQSKLEKLVYSNIDLRSCREASDVVLQQSYHLSHPDSAVWLHSRFVPVSTSSYR